MATVTIYLGGTGKYIASLAKRRAAIYGDADQLTDFTIIDLDPSDPFPGSYSIIPELVTPRDHPNHPGGDPTYDVGAAISAWKGNEVGNDRFRPGAELQKIAADSLLGEFTAAQEGLWTLRGAGPIAMAALQPTNTWVIFEDWLKARLNASGGMLRVNMVASIAGGTGAGLLVHVAQYVRKTAQLANIQVTIQAVVALPSIFNQAWGFSTDEGNISWIARSRGNTGAFAALRDIELLTSLPDRHVTPGFHNLELRPGVPLEYFGFRIADEPQFFETFDRVNYLGRRQIDSGRSSDYLFVEAERFLAALPHLGLAGGAGAAARNRLLIDTTVIEYPLLEKSSELAGQIGLCALSKIMGNADEPGDASANILTQPNFSSEIGTRLLKPNASGCYDPAKSDRFSWDDLRAAVSAFAPDDAFSNIPRGTARPLPSGTLSEGYTADDVEWGKYCELLFKDLEERRKELESKLESAARDRVRQTRVAAVAWVRSNIIERVSGGPANGWSIIKAQKTLERQRAIVRQVRMRHHKDKSWETQTIFDDKDIQKTITEAEGVLGTARANLQSPVPDVIDGSWRYLWLSALVIALLAGFGLALLLSYLQFDVTTAVIGGIVCGLITAYLVVRRRQQPTDTIDKLRKRAEDQLFHLYTGALQRRAVDHLWAQIYDEFAVKLEGKGTAQDDKNARGLLGALDDELEHLRKALEAIRLRLRHETTLEQPPAVVQWLAPNAVSDSVSEMTRARLCEDLRHTFVVSVEGAEGAGGGVAFRWALQPAPGCLVGAAPTNVNQHPATWPQVCRDFLTLAEERSRAMVYAQLDGDGAGIPTTLEAALIQQHGAAGAETILASALAELVHQASLRRSSARVDPALAGDAAQRVLLVDGANLDLLNRAMAKASVDVRSYFAQLQPTLAALANQGIVLAKVWTPNNLDSIDDIKEARKAYYSIGHAIDRRPPPHRVRYCGYEPVFNVLPETAAASAIEFEAGRTRPLDLAVTTRLYGSDIRMPGPTLIALFYMLRALKRISSSERDLKKLYQLHWAVAAEPPVRLVTAKPARTGADDPIGAPARRGFLVALDAFILFMTYDGAPIEEATPAISFMADGDVHAGEWFALHHNQKLLSAQRAVRQTWTEIANGAPDDCQALHDEMMTLLSADVATVDQREGNVAGAGFATSWEVVGSTCITDSRVKLCGG